jgi:hypothetical protein
MAGITIRARNFIGIPVPFTRPSILPTRNCVQALTNALNIISLKLVVVGNGRLHDEKPPEHFSGQLLRYTGTDVLE